MRFFTEKRLTHKIIIAVVIVLLLNFIMPTISSAGIGGILFEPIKDLLLVLADGIMGLSQDFIFDMNVSFLTVYHKDSGWKTVATVGGTILGVALSIAAAPFTGGFSLTGAILLGVGGGYVVRKIASNAIPPTFKLPIFLLTPESMFSNSISLLDVNFFENAQDKNMKRVYFISAKEQVEPLTAEQQAEVARDFPELIDFVMSMGKAQSIRLTEERYNEVSSQFPYIIEKCQVVSDEYIETTTPTGQTVYTKSSALTLKPIISKWYYALRNFAIVALLCILVYTAIKIIISSSAEDKAKYKQRLIDWLVAMCLLFFMHYIMAFAVTLTEEITSAVNAVNKPYYVAIGTSADTDKLSDYKYGNGAEDDEGSKIFGTGELQTIFRENGTIVTDSDTGNEVLMWPTNLMGKARIELQLEPNDITEDDIEVRKFGYTAVYLALVIYTMLFLFRYLKRLLMLVFLTIIAPLMAMTYPLDKMRDGNAQGFNMWIKEYLYNLLIQPVHLILYTVLIGSAIDLVQDNLLYAIVALGFILQAEKILRRFFGFDKASTLEGGSALGGALAMQGLNMANKFLGGKKRKEKGEGGEKKGNSGKNRLQNRTRDSGHTSDQLFDNAFGENNDNTPPRALEENNPNLNAGGARQEGGSTFRQPRETNNHSEEPRIPNPDDGIFKYAADKWKSNPKRIQKANEKQAKKEDKLRANSRKKDFKEAIKNDKREKRQIRRMAKMAEHPVRYAIGRSLGNSARAIGKGVAHVAPTAGKVALRTLAKGGQFATRTAIKGTLAGTGAMIGMASGLVSDNFSNVAKWGAAGLGGGWVAGSGITGIPNKLEGAVDGIKGTYDEQYKDTHTPDEIEARENKIADRQWRNDDETVKLYAEKLEVSKKQAKEIMKKDAQKYREYGITDDKTIIKAMKAKGFGEDKASNERILLAQMATQVSKPKDLEDLQKGLIERRNIPEDIAKKYTGAIRTMNNWA